MRPEALMKKLAPGTWAKEVCFVCNDELQISLCNLGAALSSIVELDNSNLGNELQYLDFLNKIKSIAMGNITP